MEPTRPTARPGRKFAGVNVNILTFNGPQVAEPLQRRAPDWEALTGGHVNVVAVGVPDDLRQGAARRVDRHQQLRRLRVQPAVAGRLRRSRLPRGPDRPGRQRRPARLGGHRPVLPRLQRDLQRQGLHDPARRRLPHGLLPQGHPRPDGIAPPTTWDDYLAVAEKFNGQDLNEDGEPDYGSCIAKKKGAQSYWWIISVAAGLLQGQGTGDGAFFDTANMDPLFGNNEAMTKALQTYKETTDFGPPDELNLDVGDTRGLFTTGRCALSMDWGDIGTLTPGHLRPGQDRRDDHAGLDAGPRPRHRHARAVRRDHLPERGRRRELRPVRLVRRLVGRGQRRVPTTQQDAAYDVPVVHERAGAVGRGRHARQDRLQPVPHLAVREHPAVARRRAEPGRRRPTILAPSRPASRTPTWCSTCASRRPKRYEQDVLDTALAQYLAGELDEAGTEQAITDGWNAITDEVGQGPAARCVHREPWRRALARIDRATRRAVTRRSAHRQGPTASARWLFIWPTVLVILVLSLFPLVASVVLSRLAAQRSSRARSTSSSSGSRNYQQLLFGLERSHFLGVLKTPNPLGWLLVGATVVLVGIAWTRAARSGQLRPVRPRPPPVRGRPRSSASSGCSRRRCSARAAGRAP